MITARFSCLGGQDSLWQHTCVRCPVSFYNFTKLSRHLSGQLREYNQGFSENAPELLRFSPINRRLLSAKGTSSPMVDVVVL